jgi:hypothetical protein
MGLVTDLASPPPERVRMGEPNGEHRHEHEHGHEHGHQHGHEHGHEHDHVPSTEAPFVDHGPLQGPPEALVLDIGALMLFADEACLGSEIDVTPQGEPRSHLLHTMIRRRRAVDREFIVGVVPEITAGIYTVWGVDGHPLGDVTIIGGEVTELQVGTGVANGGV